MSNADGVVAAAIVAPGGSPLGAAVVSCAQLESSVAFYRDEIGLAAGPIADWRGSVFERLWELPPGAAARACLLSGASGPVGRLLLLEFDARALRPGQRPERIQRTPNSQVFGLANLNFYSRDIVAATRDLGSRGWSFWSAPTRHGLDEAVGNPIEVIFDGPDGVAINLVQLTSTDPATRIGQMRSYVERLGYTPQGFTPVVTTSQVVRSMVRARGFFERVLGMGVLIDDELHASHVNAFLRLPEDAVTHVSFMQGNHMFGKIALSQPINYAERCEDLRPRARAPNVGYLAQLFEVSDLCEAERACRDLGVEVVAARAVADLPGYGQREHLMVRNPGSGALQWLVSGP